MEDRSEKLAKARLRRAARREEWQAEMNEVLLSLDVERFKEFYYKWQKRGFYSIQELPSDDIIEIALRKIIVNSEDMPAEQFIAAKDWLLSRGYDLRLY